MELTHTIHIPEVLNRNTIDTLHKSIMQTATLKATVVVLQSLNDHIFCRGMDVNNFGDEHEENAAYLFADCLFSLRTLAKSTIAIVQGETLGGGNGIAAACDVVFATEQARFSLPEGLFGLMPAIVTVMLEERVSAQKIRTWALSCTDISATDAQHLGLVDKVVTTDELQQTVKQQAKKFSRCSIEAVQLLKSKRCKKIQKKLQAAAQETTKRLESDEVKRRIECWQQGMAPWDIE
jgi:enoyl-CoA hydratase/carnithine racemase